MSLRKPQKPLTEKVNTSTTVLERPSSTSKAENDRQARQAMKNIRTSDAMRQVLSRPDNIKAPTRLEKKRTSIDLTQEEMMKGLALAQARADTEENEPAPKMEAKIPVKQVTITSPRRGQWNRDQGDRSETIQQKRPRSPKKKITNLDHQKESRIRGNPVTWGETTWTAGTQPRAVNMKTSTSKATWNRQMSGSVMKSALGGGDNW